MGLFHKLKRWTIARFYRESSTDRNRQRVIPTQYEYDQLPSSFFQAVNSARLEAGYDTLPTFHRNSSKTIQKENFLNREHVPWSSGHRRSSDPSQYPRLDQHHSPPGTPIKYRRRPISPDLLQRQFSSPNFIDENSWSPFQSAAYPQNVMFVDSFYPVIQPHTHLQAQWFQSQPMHFFY